MDGGRRNQGRADRSVRSDEFGWKAEQQIVSAHDLHASMLHLIGMDHKRLTYFYNGRNMRLTDVAGEFIPQIVA